MCDEIYDDKQECGGFSSQSSGLGRSRGTIIAPRGRIFKKTHGMFKCDFQADDS